MKPLSKTLTELGIDCAFPIEIMEANDRPTSRTVMITGRGTSEMSRGGQLTTKTVMASGRGGSVMQMVTFFIMRTAQA
jgi:hypothetical protein